LSTSQSATHAADLAGCDSGRAAAAVKRGWEGHASLLRVLGVLGGGAHEQRVELEGCPPAES
jgi:hypothetical protein